MPSGMITSRDQAHAMLEIPSQNQSAQLTRLTTHSSFLTRAYPTMKKNNPYTPIMIREAMNIEPRVYARYEFGVEKVEDLKGET